MRGTLLPELVHFGLSLHRVRGQPQEQVMSTEINWYYFRKG